MELLERKGLGTKQDPYDIITTFRRKNLRASIPEPALSETYFLIETETKIIVDILEWLHEHGPTSNQSINLLERVVGIIEVERRTAKGTTHQRHPSARRANPTG